MLVIGGQRFTSRLFTGTGKFASGPLAAAALAASGTELVTVAIRYVDLEHPRDSGVLEGVDLERYRLLPNTAGATNAEHAVKMARLARAATGTDLIKLEVIGDKQYLWPDNAETIVATKQLTREGFVVLPYVSADLVTALRLEEAGAATVMPLASPIGSGQGYNDWVGIERIVRRVSLPVVVDAGIGVPSEAAMAMELGAAAVLVNTAIARAKDPVAMAHAMKLAVIAGRIAYRAGRMSRRTDAEPSSPQHGVPKAPTAA
ncbi:MAG: thiazole synthase [Chloroflexota bacterium]|nr:thiazole synthase [Chloroflexota bacterium]